MRARRAIPLAAVALCACGEAAGAPRPSPTPKPPAPALIQVENLAAARPQSGLGAADVVYEYLTEGGISRFSVIYLHPPALRVGPIRSARLVTITLVERYGAVLIYSGAGRVVEQRIEQAAFPRFTASSAGGALFRVSDRDAPHNLYTDGARIGELLDRAQAPPVTWALWPRTTAAPPSAASATSSIAPAPVTRFSVPISSSEVPTWTYSASRGGYTRTEPDTGAFTDANTRQPLVAATVIVQQVSVTPAPEVEDVNGAHGVEQDILSGGPAQVFSGGYEYDATWSQPASGPPAFKLRNGARAPITPGEVWIELVPVGSPARAIE